MVGGGFAFKAFPPTGGRVTHEPLRALSRGFSTRAHARAYRLLPLREPCPETASQFLDPHRLDKLDSAIRTGHALTLIVFSLRMSTLVSDSHSYAQPFGLAV